MTPFDTLPFAQPNPLEVPPALRRLQHDGPIHTVRTRVGDLAWLVTDHVEVRRPLADDRLGRSHPDPASAARTSESALFGGPVGNHDTERADHARMRSSLQPLFSPGRMRALEPRVESLLGGLLDDLARAVPPVDLLPALALPLPVLVICELLGVPYADRGQFRDWTRAAADLTDQAASQRGLAELFAGYETTAVQIGFGVLFLLTNPEQRRALLVDPSLVGRAVEEILRAPAKSNGGIPRYAHADIDVHGTTINAGDLVLLDGAPTTTPVCSTSPNAST